MKTTRKVHRILVEEIGSGRYTPALHTLEDDEVLRIEIRRKPRRVTCLEGCLWVTQEGDRNDYVLRKGETFRSAARGVLYIQSLCQSGGSGEESSVRIA